MQHDKRLHLIAGMGISFLAAFTATIINFPMPFLIGFISGVLAGIGKEAYDYYLFRKGQHPIGYDVIDFLYTCLGSAIVGLIFLIPEFL